MLSSKIYLFLIGAFGMAIIFGCHKTKMTINQCGDIITISGSTTKITTGYDNVNGHSEPIQETTQTHTDTVTMELIANDSIHFRHMAISWTFIRNDQDKYVISNYSFPGEEYFQVFIDSLVFQSYGVDNYGSYGIRYYDYRFLGNIECEM